VPSIGDDRLQEVNNLLLSGGRGVERAAYRDETVVHACEPVIDMLSEIDEILPKGIEASRGCSAEICYLTPEFTAEVCYLTPEFTPEVCYLTPEFTPEVSYLTQEFTPEVSYLTPEVSYLTPEVSHLTPEATYFATEFADVTVGGAGEHTRRGRVLLACPYPAVQVADLIFESCDAWFEIPGLHAAELTGEHRGDNSALKGLGTIGVSRRE